MRYSAFQEVGYGVGLGQELPPNVVDESMMAATGETESAGNNTTEENSMVSNLPLLFANGYPTSLDKMKMSELERFITFMVQCSLGQDTVEEIREPQWWPKEIKFSIPFVRPKKINENYMTNLKKLVFRCYTYHRSEYLLRFCSYLSQYPHENLEYVNNWDSTTSLYLKTSGKILVTFRNENMKYDERKETSKRMMLKVDKPSLTNGSKCLRRRSQRQVPSPAMVQPPMDDIYLCDNCDAEFVGLRRMKEHEKLCYHVEPRPITPEPEEMPELTQPQFLDYFKLNETNSSNKPDTNLDKQKRPYGRDLELLRSSSRVRTAVNLTRCPTIPFSSPAGLMLAKKSKMMTESTQQERLDRIERHMSAPVLNSKNKHKWCVKTNIFDRWPVSFKPNRDKTSKPREYVHLYNFGDYSGKPALDLKSQLLFLSCKKIFVVLQRQTDKELEELRNNPEMYKSPEPEIIINRPRSPSVESVPVTPAPGDESNPIIIDLDDEDEYNGNKGAEDNDPQIIAVPSRPLPSPYVALTTPIAVAQPQRIQNPNSPTNTATSLSSRTLITFIPVSDHPKSSHPHQLMTHSQQQPILFQPTNASRRSFAAVAPIIRSPPTKRPRTNEDNDKPHSSKNVVLVDLCSSDDEGDEKMDKNKSSGNDDIEQIRDENQDPLMKDHQQGQRLSEILRFVPSRIVSKPCIYPADSTSSWLPTETTCFVQQHHGSPALRSTP